MSNVLIPLVSSFAQRYSMGDSIKDIIETLRATCFKASTPVTDAQLISLLIVSGQYKLNPFTKEIYAFPDRNNGIVPVLGVDGWSRIINGNPMFDGMSFDMAADGSWCKCRIYRKDRSHPVEATEYLDECYRETPPWKSHKRRMLRHKAMIQCARMAFGFAGIYDHDEAERIMEIDITPKTGQAIGEAARIQGFNTPEVAATIERLKFVASNGTETELQTEWLALTKAQRNAIGGSCWAEIKAMLPQDAVDGEVVE